MQGSQGCMPRAEVETVALFLRAARSAMHINSAARSAIHINDRQAALSAIDAAASIVDRVLQPTAQVSALAVEEPSEQAPAPAPTAAVLQLTAPAEPAEPAERSGRQLVGTRVRVWWEEEATWFSGTVDYYNEARGKHRVRYDDGDRRTYDLFGEGAIHPDLPHPSSLTPTLAAPPQIVLYGNFSTMSEQGRQRSCHHHPHREGAPRRRERGWRRRCTATFCYAHSPAARSRGARCSKALRGSDV